MPKDKKKQTIFLKYTEKKTGIKIDKFDTRWEMRRNKNEIKKVKAWWMHKTKMGI